MIQRVERYTIDPERVSLQLFYERTRSKKLIPSRITLQDGMGGTLKPLPKWGSIT